MKRFAALVLAPDDAALHRYFGQAPDEDRLWALALLTGRRPPCHPARLGLRGGAGAGLAV